MDANQEIDELTEKVLTSTRGLTTEQKLVILRQYDNKTLMRLAWRSPSSKELTALLAEVSAYNEKLHGAAESLLSP